MNELVIFGAGSLAQLVCTFLRDEGAREVAAFTVHAAHRTGEPLLGLEVAPFERLAQTHPPDRFDILVAVGYRGVNRARAEVFETCRAAGYRMPGFVSAHAICSTHARLGANCLVLPGSVVQPFAELDDDVVVWGATVEHGCRIGAHCFLASGAVVGGNVRMDRHCFVGLNATVLPRVCLARATVVGAGAVVQSDTVAQAVYPGPRASRSELNAGDLRTFR